jgi:transposase InsO family protein
MKMSKAKRDIRRKLRILDHVKKIVNIRKTCRYFGVSRAIFYRWRDAYDQFGEERLINKKPCPENRTLRMPVEVEEKILYIRKNYHLGPDRITFYLKRYHDITVSGSGVYRALKRHGYNRLPRNAKRRTVQTVRYEKQVPGHHIQVDVKFLIFPQSNGTKIKRFQYTAIDDATRIRALKVYERHNQQNAIDFIDYVINKFPFRIQTVRTDNGHEFQSKFHWHVEDQGIRHVYIKPGTPRLNGKVERSHRTDKKEEFYQLLSYNGDVDLKEKLNEWEAFYNYQRPHGAFKGKGKNEGLKK